MKILKKSFTKVLSLSKIFGTILMLLLGNPSEGVGLPSNSMVFGEVVKSTPFTCSFQLHERASLGVLWNNISERISLLFFQPRKYSLKPAEK